MGTQFTYTCPNCTAECYVAEECVAANVICPTCEREFYATPPEQLSTPPPVQSQAPAAKLPFFKFSRRKLLRKRLEELTADGEMDKGDQKELDVMALSMGLEAADVEKLAGEKFLEEFKPIKQRVESNLMLTDEDLSDIRAIEKKYNVTLGLAGDHELLRAIYLMEIKGQLPRPINTGLMLDPDERAYYLSSCTWQQVRVHSRGYSGSSVSIPTGIRGVRFRFGGYTPIRCEELTPLSDGSLCITSKKVLFAGESRSTSILLKRIVDCHIYSDALKIDKSTGKADYFTLRPAQSRYATALLAALKRG